MDQTYETLRHFSETIIIAGGAVMALGYGLRRVYRTARNVDELLQHAQRDKEERDVVAARLAAHISQEESRDIIRDKQMIEITSSMQEVLREIRPNGGSSIKDVVNQINTRVAVIEQWKSDHTP